MLANRGRLDGVRMLSPSSVKLMTSNLLPAGVPLLFTQPFVGIGYGRNVWHRARPIARRFQRRRERCGHFLLGGLHGTWFWVDPTYDIVVVGMLEQQDGGNPMTGRPYPVPDVRGISRSNHLRSVWSIPSSSKNSIHSREDRSYMAYEHPVESSALFAGPAMCGSRPFASRDSFYKARY